MSLIRLLAVAGLLLAAAPAALAAEWQSLDEGSRPSERLVIGGQPTAELLREAAAAGIEVVVNLRPLDEEDPGYDEPALVAELGMKYLQVPVGREGGLSAKNLERFDAILREVGDRPMLMHCSTGNRVGAMYALHAARYRGLDTEAALEVGKAHGLTHFEDVVRAELEDAPRP